MKGIKFIFIIIITSMTLSCSQESEFEDVINSYIKDKKLCFGYIDKMPATVVVGQERAFGTVYSSKKMDALVKVGLLESHNTKQTVQNSLFTDGNMDVVEVPAKTYNLSIKGSKYLLNKKFCFGGYKVEEIINYTEPTSFLGRVITNVKYTYIIQNIPEWIKDSKLLAELFDVEKELKDIPIESEITLHRTSKGWQK